MVKRKASEDSSTTSLPKSKKGKVNGVIKTQTQRDRRTTSDMVKRKVSWASGSAVLQKSKKGKVNGVAPSEAGKVTHRSFGSTAGVALTLGEGDVGQLGLGPDIMERVKPAMVPELPDNMIQVCAGGMHTVCLTTDGKVYTFGCNDEGALGRKPPEDDDCTVPGQVGLDAHIVQVSAGDSHSGALSDDGRVFIWGVFRDANGRIGLTPAGDICFDPIHIMQDFKVQKIASGTDHLACLTVDGDIYTVGNGEQGQLGRVAECFSYRGGRKGLKHLLIPNRVAFTKRKSKFQDLWTGQYSMYAQETNDGPVHAWGLNNYFQLGFGDTENRFVPSIVKAFTPDKKWLQVAGGQHHAVALDGQGKVYSIGRKEYGRLGLGEDCVEAETPTMVPALSTHTCTSVSCGTAVSFAVTNKGDVFAWGMGTSKQLAQREEDDLWEPTIMEGKQLETRSVSMVTSGGQHTVLLASDK